MFTSYDMDGDGYINSPLLVDSASDYYVDRLAVAVNADLNLERDGSGNLVGDDNIDGDSLSNAIDLDADNDGMYDHFSLSGYKYEVLYGVANGGWQHPFIHNERYALLISGFDPDADHDGMGGYDAFRNDLVEMYDTLKMYGYSDEQIYCYFWDGTESLDGRVDGDAIWELPNTNDGNIKNAIKDIGSKITVNDFFYFFEISHGSNYYGSSTAGWFWTYYPVGGIYDYIMTVGFSTLDLFIDQAMGSH